jgi:hypothetical protein
VTEGGVDAAVTADAADAHAPQGFVDGGAVGGTCQVNTDCANSPAAAAFSKVRCAGGQIYRWQGLCHADCMSTCTIVRTDVNPCATPRICEPRLGGQESFCAMTPARCQTAAQCPSYLPSTDAGQAVWTCDDGGCAYPGYQFPTR